MAVEPVLFLQRFFEQLSTGPLGNALLLVLLALFVRAYTDRQGQLDKDRQTDKDRYTIRQTATVRQTIRLSGTIIRDS